MKRCKALVVEDEPLVALLIEDHLRDLGVEDVVFAHSLEAGLRLARDVPCDFAVLDINLNGERSFPIADVMRQRDIPFLFSSGYGSRDLEERYADHPVLTKPYSAQAFQEAIRQLFGQG